MRVVLSREAQADAIAIRNWIARDRPRAAEDWARLLLTRLRLLRDHPRAGRVVPEHADADLRELMAGPYRIWYRIAGDHVRVLCVWDGRRGEIPDRVREIVAEYVISRAGLVQPKWYADSRIPMNVSL